MKNRSGSIIALSLVLAGCSPRALQPTAPASLPSWNDGPARQTIVDFVRRVTAPGTGHVPEAERIAVFDNDGTLWAEQPMYFQVLFALDRIKSLAPGHPEWADTEPFKSVVAGDMKGVMAGGEGALMQILAASHTGVTTDEFDAIVRQWIASARHPQSGRLYTQMTYQPMREMLDFLRANGFKTYIVSGGGVEFMRPWVEAAYGIPPEQVVGSRARVKYELRGQTPVLMRLPEIDLIDDKAGKPVGIHQVIGRRPVMAFRNSDGDFEMLEWTTSAPGPRLGAIVHHTDADREYAYDRDSHIGQLVRGLDEAPKRNWVVIDMKKDWKTVYRRP